MSILSVYLSIYLFLHLSICFPVIYVLPVSSRHICRFTPSSYLKFLSFITLSIPFPASGLYRRRRPPSGDQVIIREGHLLSCMRATCPCHFNVFSLLSKIVLPPFFSLITSFVTFSGLEVHAAPVQKSISVRNSFFFLILYSSILKLSTPCILILLTV